ncbi:MAG: hypothetical protein AAGC55_11495 [Myxococcota bacterium]
MTPNHLLERALWDLFWLPPDVRVVDRPEFVLLRCPRPVRSLNTVLRTRAEPPALPALIAEAKTAHNHIGSRWVVTDTFDAGPLETALTAADYAPAEHHHARAIAIDEFRAAPASHAAIHPVDSMQRLRDAVSVADRVFGDSSHHSDNELDKALRQCTAPQARVHRLVAYERSGAPVATGSLTCYPSLNFGLLWGGCTVNEARGRGLYSAILARRVAVARARGIRYIGLYARVDTSSPIVERRGFASWGAMSFWDWTPEVS